MAGLDKMHDTQEFIQKYIGQKIRELLEYPMNQYQDPNWVQAMLLFERVVIPCESYTMNWLYDLAEDIVKKAAKHNFCVIYQAISGMYNEKALDVKAIDMENLPENIERWDYKENVSNIKKWMENFKSE